MTSSIQVSEALSAIRMGLEFAYKQGLHEFGSDPVETVETALAMRSKDHSIAVDDVLRQLAIRLTPNPCKSVDETLSIIRTAIGSQSIEGERLHD